jgi:hypothetical protein
MTAPPSQICSKEAGLLGQENAHQGLPNRILGFGSSPLYFSDVNRYYSHRPHPVSQAETNCPGERIEQFSGKDI